MKVYCIYCRSEQDYTVETRKINEYKGIKIDTYENVAVCSNCKNDLYIDNIENENTIRINEAYRDKAGIITANDIISLREKYNISQRELTAILGFGKMTINSYEKGRVPTKSQSDYLKLLISNEQEFINKVKEAYNKKDITKKTYSKVIENSTQVAVHKKDIQEIYRDYINTNLMRRPDIYNGYKTFNLELVENIISYISSKVNNLTLTSLNKYLWFIDVISFKERGVSITGLTYQKQQFGPTIIEQKYKEISLLEEKYMRNELEEETGTKTYITSNNNYDLNMLKDSEIQIIDRVINILKNKNVKEISELSHKQDGWIKTKKFENISFEYSIDMEELD